MGAESGKICRVKQRKAEKIAGSLVEKGDRPGSPGLTHQKIAQKPPDRLSDPENFSSDAENFSLPPAPADPESAAAMLPVYRAARARADAVAAALRAEALSGRLVPRQVLDDLVGEVGRRLDACAHRLDAAYGPGPAQALVDTLAGLDEWLSVRLDRELLRLAVGG